MEFISAEEFLKQSKEVQEIFIKWWEPKPHDLIGKLNGDYCLVDELIQPNKPKNFKNRYIENKKYVPLFTEGQLRKFIEDKGFRILEIFRGKYTDKWCIKISKNDEFNIRNSDTCDNLLQTYWEIACEIAKESVDNERISSDY